MITEHIRTQTHRSRARSFGMPATLSCEEWEQTIADFNGLCAYCLNHPFQVLEHFVPVSVAGTTATNCIPACFQCNYKKSNLVGAALVEIFGDATINRISQYLKTRESAGNTTSTLQQPRWSTRPKQTRYIAPRLEEKQQYSIQELHENLTITLADLARASEITPKSLNRILYGDRVTRNLANKLLLVLSKVYDRPLTIKNVTGINLYK
ncbi:HNH endonuclease [Dictyobacter kobayashii]|uniref:HNH endonuclease n=1 Tax=Dictyobacter kobayashii TaxID=2014872 RepID=UPI000F828E39|nr:HNH endonuclease [Dictyobacter kobayashii]